jgi:hypothetical protein
VPVQGALPLHVLLAFEVRTVHHLGAGGSGQIPGNEAADFFAEGILFGTEGEVHGWLSVERTARRNIVL